MLSFFQSIYSKIRAKAFCIFYIYVIFRKELRLFRGRGEELVKRIYVCEVCRFEKTDVFQTDLKQVFDCIRYADNPEKLYELITSDPVYQELDEETYDVIAEHIKTVDSYK